MNNMEQTLVASDAGPVITCPVCGAGYCLNISLSGVVEFCGMCGYPDPAPCDECGVIMCKCEARAEHAAIVAPVAPAAPAGAVLTTGPGEDMLEYLMRGGGETSAY